MSSASDPWTSTAYKASSSFVPQLTSKVTQWLAPQPRDRILDLGCGDGVLTATLIKPHCAHITALDASPNLIDAARKDYGHIEGIEWGVQDCTKLEDVPLSQSSDSSGHKGAGFDKVFSNAAFHWILRNPATRLSTIENSFRLLRPGGTLVFEMGGPSNVAEVHAALISALIHRGVPLSKARETSPWYFPSEMEMRGLLEQAGFIVERIEVEHRPTRLTQGVKGGGLEGWVRLHGDAFLRVAGEEQRDDVVREVCDVLESVIGRDEEYYLGYVRLRVLARKPQTGN